MAKILDGKAIAQQIRSELKTQVEGLSLRGITPCLAIILVGEDPASQSYVRSKEKAASALGIKTIVNTFSTDVSEATLLDEIDKWNTSDEVDAILVQLPLPSHIDSEKVLDWVDPKKDADGFHPYNVGRYASGTPIIWPCTPSGILEILKRSDIDIDGRTAVVVGRSQIVGWPMAQLLLRNHATVIQCHSRTKNLESFTQLADILVCAAGQAGLITDRHIKHGSVIVDVGMNRVDGKLVGDVDFSSVVHKAGAITPVPGGVGPMTVTMLMYNTIRMALRRRGESERTV